MTKERAIHKIDFLIKAYQNLIDHSVCSGEVLGNGVKGSWESDKAPTQEYQAVIDALKMAKDALQEKPQCIAAITISDDKMRELCHEAARELFEEINKAYRNKVTAEKVLYPGDSEADGSAEYNTALCPACGYAFQNGFSEWLQPYCSHCGQKLDWSFEKIEEEGSDE